MVVQLHHVEPPGSGAPLGNLYSSAGSFLERRLGKLAYRASLKSLTKAETDLAFINLGPMLRSNDIAQNEKCCNILLCYASSHNPAIQVMAFAHIVLFFVRFPSLRRVAELICQKRNEHIDIVTFSWKRPGVEYSSLWLSYYNVALRGLSTHPSSVILAVENLRRDPGDMRNLTFSDVLDILACCRDKADITITVECFCQHWNGYGLDTYVERKGYNDPILLKLAVTFCTLLSDIAIFPLRLQHSATLVLIGIINFIHDIWDALEPDKADELLEDDSQLAVWTEIFKMQCILQSSPGRRALSTEWYWYIFIKKTWKEECHVWLPNPEHAELRERLLRLEDIHGDATRTCFPPATVKEYGEFQSLQRSRFGE